MKVAIDFITKLDPKNSRYRLELCKNLSKVKNIDIYVIYNSTKPSLKGNFNFQKINSGYSWKSDNRVLSKISPDAIILFALAGKKLIKKYQSYLFLENVFSKEEIYGGSRKVRKLLRQEVSYRAFLVHSEYLKIYLSNHYEIEKEKFICTYRGLDEKFSKENIPNKLQDVRRTLSIYRLSKPYIFLYGDLDKSTNIDKAIEAFAMVHQKFPDLKLLITSSEFKMGWDNKPQPLTPLAQEILDKCSSLQVFRKVVFSGIIEPKYMPIILANAEFVMHLSDLMEYSTTITESLSAGTPLLINDNQISKELAGGASLNVSAKIIDSVMEAMIELLSNNKTLSNLSRKSLNAASRFNWKYISESLGQKLLQNDISKPKPELLFVSDKKNDRADNLKKIFSSSYIVDQFDLEDNPKSLFQRLTILRKSFSDKKIVYVHSLKSKLILFLLILFKFRQKDTAFVYNLDQINFADKTYSLVERFKKFAKRMVLGVYLRLIFNKFLIKNPIQKRKYRTYGIAQSKIDHIDQVFEIKVDRDEVGKFRDDNRLKNYVCITTILSRESDFEMVYQLAQSLYEKTKSFKFLVIWDHEIFQSSQYNTKVLKRVFQFSMRNLTLCLYNSRIYLDFRKNTEIRQLLAAMESRNACVTKINDATKYLVKPGINGYTYNDFESSELMKQIGILVDNKVQLNDIRKINKARLEDFSLAEVSKRASKIIKKWQLN